MLRKVQHMIQMHLNRRGMLLVHHAIQAHLNHEGNGVVKRAKSARRVDKRLKVLRLYFMIIWVRKCPDEINQDVTNIKYVLKWHLNG